MMRFARRALLAFAVVALAMPEVYPAGQSGPLFLVQRNGLYGFADRSGRIVIAPTWSLAAPFGDGLAAVRDERQRWGYINTEGALRIPHEFVAARRFSEGLAAAAAEAGQFAYINAGGQRVITGPFADAQPFSEGLAAVRDQAQWRYIDQAGKDVFDGRFEQAGPFHDGVAPVRSGGLWQYIDRQGKPAFRGSFLSARPSSGDTALVMSEGRWSAVYPAGREMWRGDAWDLVLAPSEGMVAVRAEDAPFYSYVDLRTGTTRLSGPFSQAGPFENELALIRNEVFGTRYYITASGEKAFDFSDRAEPTPPGPAGGSGASLIRVDLSSDPPGATVFMVPVWNWERMNHTLPAGERVHYRVSTGPTETSVQVLEKVFMVVFERGDQTEVVRLDVRRAATNVAKVIFK